MVSLVNGLNKIRSGLIPAISKSDKANYLKQLEINLLSSDVGTKATGKIIELIKAEFGSNPDIIELNEIVQNVIINLLKKVEVADTTYTNSPHVIMMLGTNGGGKTTTVAKIARQAVAQNLTVVLAACDTFRAAAEQQLQELANRLGENVRVIPGNKDPGATAYNAVDSAIAKKDNLVIIDTAGRQPTSKTLMAEAQKINKAVSKAMSGSPHEKILAIDANTGQNALMQLNAFHQELGLTSCVITKLDGTARGGSILAIAVEYALAVKYIGIGEGVDDLLRFNATDFTRALFTLVE